MKVTKWWYFYEFFRIIALYNAIYDFIMQYCTYKIALMEIE